MSDIIRMLRVSESDPVQQEAADEIERLRAELAAERETVAETKALIPNKHDTGVKPRPFENADWWSVAIIERRKRIAAEKDNTVLRDMHLENEAKYAATRRERDTLRELLREARAALKGTLGYGIDDRSRRAGHAAVARIDAALNKGGGDE